MKKARSLPSSQAQAGGETRGSHNTVRPVQVPWKRGGTAASPAWRRWKRPGIGAFDARVGS